MALVPIDKVTEGMVLAQDVRDRNGRMLLGAGSELNEKHLRIFRTWGVAEAAIVGVDEAEAAPQLPAEISPEEVAEAEEALMPLFHHSSTDHPALRELLRLAALRKVVNGRA